MWSNADYQFEFAKPAFAWRAVRWPGVVLVLLLTIAVGIAYAVLTEQAMQVQALVQRQQQLLAQHVTEHPAPTSAQKAPPKPAIKLSQPEQKAAEKIVQQLNVRWFDLLQALEAKQVPEVALLQLLPDANRGQFVLSGEAKNYQALLKYVSQLQTVAVLEQVHLQKHQVNESHPQRPVSFEIQGGWQP